MKKCIISGLLILLVIGFSIIPAQTRGIEPGKNCPGIVQNLRDLLRDTPDLTGQIQTALEGQEKGEYLGRFGYGGSSILLVFEPGRIKYSECFPIFNSGDGGIPVQVKKQIGFAVK